MGVRIFSSIRPDEIDLSKTRAAGVTDLKNYLEFAVKGPRALVEQALPAGVEPESPLEMEVIGALRDKGWKVHPQVGCSRCRVDMAVVHPHEPGRYVLGIEGDGATLSLSANCTGSRSAAADLAGGIGLDIAQGMVDGLVERPWRELHRIEISLNGRLESSAASSQS